MSVTDVRAALEGIVQSFGARKVGHTSLMVLGAKAWADAGRDVIMVTNDQRQAEQLRGRVGHHQRIQVVTRSSFDPHGHRSAVVWDHHALVSVLGLAVDKIGELREQLEQANYELGQKEAEVKAAYDKGYEEGGEAMREAIIREVSGGSA